MQRLGTPATPSGDDLNSSGEQEASDDDTNLDFTIPSPPQSPEVHVACALVPENALN